VPGAKLGRGSGKAQERAQKYRKNASLDTSGKMPEIWLKTVKFVKKAAPDIHRNIKIGLA
jgi:hypothetical protein